MNIETIDNSEQFFGLHDAWNALLKSSASDGVFLTHEWLASWWRHLADGRRLHLVTARENGELVGILPLAERRPQYARMMPRVFEFLGSGVIGSDYLDAIIKSEREPEVTAAFADHIHRRGMMLQLSQLRTGQCAVARIAEALNPHRWISAHTKLNVCPYINLSGLTWDQFVEKLGPSIRKNLKRYLRILPTQFDMRLQCAKTPEEADAALEIAIDLHHKRWDEAGTSEAFQTPAVINFHREFVRLAAKQGWLRILIVWLDGQAVSSLYGLRYGPTFYFYQSGFDPAFKKHSVGVATMGYAIQTAIEEGAMEYDFLHGAEEYKFHWSDATRDLGRIELYPPHARGHIYRHVIHFNRAARSVARRVLKHS